MNSPIKYYGGKHYMRKIILENFPIEYKLYVEGFGGSGSILFAKPRTDLEVYNDLEQGVYSLFKCLLYTNLFDELKYRLDLTYYSDDIRTLAKEKLKSNKLSTVDKAYYFFINNRMSYNGVGGFSRNLYIRRNMSKSCSDYLSAIDRLPEIHNRLSSVIVENLDIFDLIERYDKEDTFFYLDPPYVQSSRKSDQKYIEEMDDLQHIKLVNVLLNIKGKVLISGYDNEIYNELSKRFKKISFKSPNSGSQSIEILWRNY